jgi:hypothetical protein
MGDRTAERYRKLVGVSAIAPLSVAAFTLLLAGAAPLASTTSQDPTPEQLVVLDEAPVTKYRAYRRMYAQNEKFDKEAWLEAWTELDGGGFRYEIVRERGSEYVLNRVLRALLAREQELIGRGEADRAELTPANYEFEEPAAQGRGVRYILIKPKRKDMLLVDGRMVLNQDGTELLRVEGRLAKNPSFWTNTVNIIREFARLDGVRVPLTTESIARLKFAGLARMTVRYEYESINGRPVSVSARRAMASAAIGR